MKRQNLIFIVILLATIFNFQFISSSADFAVNGFSCTPSEAVINDLFSCTAQIKNNGDSAGSVSIATLYPDENNWLENSNYAQASGESVSPGQTTEVVFTGLRAIKSGNNGFSKIMLDDVTDTYTSDNNIQINVIDVLATISNSESSSAVGDIFYSSAEVTAGGNIDVTLTFTVNSGGCSIGSQTNPKTISGMQDGNKQSRTWSVTQGSSGDCSYTISAASTGSGGVASKIDSTSSAVTCTDCPSGGNEASGSGGSSGGGGGSGSVYDIGELGFNIIQELGKNEIIKFNISGVEHTFSLINLTETSATITIESALQTFIFNVGDEKNIDLNGDSSAEIYVMLQSVNLITNKAKFILSSLAESVPISKEDLTSGKNKGGSEGVPEESKKLFKGILIAIPILIAIFIGYFIVTILNERAEKRFNERVKISKNKLDKNKIILIFKKNKGKKK